LSHLSTDHLVSNIIVYPESSFVKPFPRPGGVEGCYSPPRRGESGEELFNRQEKKSAKLFIGFSL
jgi:hypothetical protein